MKKLILVLLLISSTCLSYNGEIKDNRGRTINYINLDEDSPKAYIYDTRGRKNISIEMDEDSYSDEIKDTYGHRKGSIKWED